MVITNANYLNPNGTFEIKNIMIKDGIIAKISDSVLKDDEEIIDAKGNYLIPGYVDIHIHGCMGSDFCDGTPYSLQTISNYLATKGVTSFCPTTMSFSEEILSDIIVNYNHFLKNNDNGANIEGINLEGPFINGHKKGAQNGKYIINPDFDMFKRLFKLSGNTISLVAVAPELEGSLEFISKAKELCSVSLAHTNANYNESNIAFNNGARHVTHLYNAMSPYNHRDSGLVGSAVENASFVELICDGIHVHPSVIRNTFTLFSSDKICLVSDSTRGCGMSDGVYDLGGQKIYVKGSKATLEDGTISGSVTSLADCVKRAVAFKIPLVDAIKSATITPAKAINKDSTIGSIEVGKKANLQILDNELNCLEVILNGKKVTI